MSSSSILRFFLFFLLALPFLSCSKQDVSRSHSLSQQTESISIVKAGNFALGQLEAHFIKHGYQFGGITQGQYLQQAQDLLNALPGEDVLEKTRPNGDIEHFRVSTSEFAVMTRNGRIRTYFKTNQRYWMRQ